MHTRGFCTIATGAYEYSQLAHNLLLSYRRFTTQNYPFTVFTDKSNDLLEDFDQVISLPKSDKSFLDKLLIFDLCPYDETIFIDADCLAYGDLSKYFDYFKDADDVSCPGEIFPVDSTRGWFQVQDTGKYKEFIDYTVWMHGGIYYVRKTPGVKAFYQTCREIEKDYKNIFFRFKYLTEPADEPIVALAMAIHKYKPTAPRPDVLAFYRDAKIEKIDIVSGTLKYQVASGSTDAGLLVHWATANTRKALYKTEAEKLNWVSSLKEPKFKLTLWEKMYWALFKMKQ